MNSRVSPYGAAWLERVLASPAGLIAVDPPDEEAFVDELATLSRFSGQAIYQWVGDRGLMHLRDVTNVLPGTGHLSGALRYIHLSQHFGLYCLRGLAGQLGSADYLALRRLAITGARSPRRIALINAPPPLQQQLGQLLVKSESFAPSMPQLRLRDGRWVI